MTTGVFDQLTEAASEVELETAAEAIPREPEGRRLEPRRYDPGRIIEIPRLTREPGIGPRAGGTVLQTAAWIGEHRWSQGSATIHPVIASMAARWNADMGDSERERRLRPVAAVLPGTMTGPGGTAALVDEAAMVLTARSMGEWLRGLVGTLMRAPRSSRNAGQANRLRQLEAQAYDRGRNGWWKRDDSAKMGPWLETAGRVARETAASESIGCREVAAQCYARSGSPAVLAGIETGEQYLSTEPAWPAWRERFEDTMLAIATAQAGRLAQEKSAATGASLLEATVQRLQRIHVALLGNLCVRARQHNHEG